MTQSSKKFPLQRSKSMNKERDAKFEALKAKNDLTIDHDEA